MRKSRGALTPAWPESRKPYCPARAAVACSRMPCVDGLEQPYIITILWEAGSMSNSQGELAVQKARCVRPSGKLSIFSG
jgi:hypothetical protein